MCMCACECVCVCMYVIWWNFRDTFINTQTHPYTKAIKLSQFHLNISIILFLLFKNINKTVYRGRFFFANFVPFRAHSLKSDVQSKKIAVFHISLAATPRPHSSICAIICLVVQQIPCIVLNAGLALCLGRLHVERSKVGIRLGFVLLFPDRAGRWRCDCRMIGGGCLFSSIGLRCWFIIVVEPIPVIGGAGAVTADAHERGKYEIF